MRKWLLIGSGVFVLLIMFGCMAARSAGSIGRASSDFKGTATPGATAVAPVDVTLIDRPATWYGFPLSRPSWCNAPAKWVMAQVPGRKEIVPACQQTRALVYLGNWTLPACTLYVAPGAPTKANTLLLEPADQLPSYGAYTTCPQPDTKIPTNSATATPTPRR